AILCASASAAAVVSYAGLLGFIGLIVPHMARKLTGHHTGYTIAVSALLGGILTVSADLAGRILAAPSEIPVGIMMSFLGAPFFLWLLRRRKGW
ncbi:MAG: iron chelate uptake ABC transporter family permease subunit, partial [Clostridia bacterium]|nr:iron chelate uptake ABC transporter family permease subunit [Clostridia bacterium]